ncbi:MAG: hypothetical protein K0M78_10380 [Brevundimonas sp.]|nr:hypothetical protein [Brevundimonas sp.]
MRTGRSVAVSLLAALALASCERTSGSSGAPPAAAFSHATTADISGYYRPEQPVRISRWSLDRVFVGQAPEFEAWEGGARSETFGPVMILFDGARVLPTRYVVTDTAVEFEGQSPELGRVTFAGRLDREALATAKRNLGGDGVVMTGTLTAGGQTVRDVRLRWWMGD